MKKSKSKQIEKQKEAILKAAEFSFSQTLPSMSETRNPPFLQGSSFTQKANQVLQQSYGGISQTSFASSRDIIKKN